MKSLLPLWQQLFSYTHLLFILIIRGKLLNLHSVFYQEVLIFSKSILPYFLFITGMLHLTCNPQELYVSV
ncbi:MAG TPA: hypothetical protein DCR68_02655 [Coprothermobacter sp.]|nr:hypothetical protein [Coprothermobacter sp.]